MTNLQRQRIAGGDLAVLTLRGGFDYSLNTYVYLQYFRSIHINDCACMNVSSYFLLNKGSII